MVYSIEGIVAKLKAARRKKGLSQEELGKKIGMPQSHVSKIEKGLVDLQTSTLIEIARILDLELMLIARENITAVEAIENYSQRGTMQVRAYQLNEGDEQE
jgi:transcriptional regulator with XRE-family HTH domain